MRRLDGKSAFMFYCDGPRNYGHTLKISFVEQPEGSDISELIGQIEASLDAIPYLKWKLAFPPLGINHPYWIQDLDFKLSNHVTHVACPRPGDKKALCKLISSLYAQTLDSTRPLWKSWIIEGLEDNRVAFVTMLHHAYTDGVGFSNLLTTVMSSDSLPSVTSEEMGVDSRKNPSRTWMFLDSLIKLPAVIFSALFSVIAGSLKVRRVKRSYIESGKPLPPEAKSAPPSPLNIALTAGRTFYYESVDLAEFKSVSKLNDATVNELFLAVVTGTIRRYYQQRGINPEEPLVAGGAINTRTEEQAREIMGNYVANSYNSLPIEIDDPAERLALVKQSSQTMKDFARDASGGGLVGLVSILPPAASDLIKWLVRKNQGNVKLAGNLGLSNVPGPTEPIILPDGKTKIVDWLSCGQIHFNHGLLMTAWSYVDKLNIMIMADETVVPDGEQFMTHVKDAISDYR